MIVNTHLSVLEVRNVSSNVRVSMSQSSTSHVAPGTLKQLFGRLPYPSIEMGPFVPAYVSVSVVNVTIEVFPDGLFEGRMDGN